ncbi:Uncharacterised protein [Rhodococcus gordoniae]|uniref:Lipoprotein n=1 Tax=Rhodococcus gordoniae TaxID=223392 RepID=A0A379M686_9NOCA|nr:MULTISPECIES: LppA family lipoprotein [Rhodococcus]UTT49799.1 LppA family lipoprotein [Rhodococcus gordoniae]SUE17266.1 Uncharacterised protein [Rhodococcus gordoniae]
MTATPRIRAGLCIALLTPLVAACTTTVSPVAMPEPIAATSAGAVEYYTAVQRDVLTALSAEFPGVRFEQKYSSTTAGCTLPDGTSGLTVHLPIHGSARPVPVDELDRAAGIFEDTAARAGFHGRHVLPPDTGLALRMFAADGSYITFGSYLAATVGLTVGCYRK